MGGQRQEKNNLDDSAVLQSITSQWWSFSSFVPLVTGALWLWLAANGGLPAVLLGAVPGALLLGTGLSGLLWAVESRTFQYMALASVLGGVLSLPAIFIFGPVAALVLALGSAASFSRRVTWPWDSTAVLPACRRPIGVYASPRGPQ